MDHDVEPGQHSLANVIEFTTNNQHVLYVDHLSQTKNEKLIKEALQSFSKDWRRVGNDTFICTAKNPLMQATKEAVENKNYSLRTNKNTVGALNLTYNSHALKYHTIERTGPDVIRKIISNPTTGLITQDPQHKGECVKTIDKDKVIIKPIKSVKFKLAQPHITVKVKTKFESTNLASWLNADLDFNAYNTMDKVHNNLIKTILFEQEYFGILRLENHLYVIETAAKEFNVDAKAAKKNFLDNVLKMNILELTKLTCVQCLSAKSLAFEFCNDNKLMGKTWLTAKSEHTGRILNWAISFDFFCGEKSALYKDNFLVGNDWADAFDESYTPVEIQRIFYRIKSGLQFIELLLEKEEMSLSKDFLGSKIHVHDAMKAINKYIAVLNNAEQIFKDHGISITEINKVKQLCKEVTNSITKANAVENSEEERERIKNEATKEANQFFQIYGFVNETEEKKQPEEKRQTTTLKTSSPPNLSQSKFTLFSTKSKKRKLKEEIKRDTKKRKDEGEKIKLEQPKK